MAVRKAVGERVVLDGPREKWIKHFASELPGAGFKHVDVLPAAGQVSAKYAKATVHGDLTVTLSPHGVDATEAVLRAVANTDNLFALFSSPTKKILDAAKGCLR